MDANKDNQSEILKRVQANRKTGEPVSALLKTDERVFARITDGIYREPASALRELIANAYDADATEVQVVTDAPRFSKIIIRDNGHGLTEEALVHVICHIGGSLKRTAEGKQHNVVSARDATLSPGGRKLIGKLGIGLFSVSQLTHHLNIVTKVRNEDVRRVCDILLMPQQEDQAEEIETKKEKKYITGKVEIYTVPASDIDSEGTEITLLDIRPFVRESLQSASLWASLNPESQEEGELVDNSDPDEDEFVEKPIKPIFHIGHVSQLDPEKLITAAEFPWSPEDTPDEKFRKLVDGVRKLDTGDSKQEKIKLSRQLDTYLKTIWTLSLSVPVSYIDVHPFALDDRSDLDIFALSNKAIRPQALQIKLESGETLRQRCGFETPDSPSFTAFNVYFDGLLLRRPLTYHNSGVLGASNAGRKLLFVGKIKSDMTSLPLEYRGGPLELEAYYYWQPRVVPVDHNGVMVRIHGSSGIMFDDQFFKYQVSEQNRLSQITAEVFVIKGLDSALNIDRESFNIAHPHYQFLKKWVHHSLRQMVSKQKALTKGIRDNVLSGGLEQAIVELEKIVESTATGATDYQRTEFTKSRNSSLSASLPFGVGAELQHSVVFSPRSQIKPRTTTEKLREALFEQKIRSVADVLQKYGLLEKLDLETQEKLLKNIVEIFTIDIK